MFGLLRQHKAHLYRHILPQKIKVVFISAVIGLAITSGYPELERQAKAVSLQKQTFASSVSGVRTKRLQNKHIYTEQIRVIALTEKKKITTPTPQEAKNTSTTTKSPILDALNAYRAKHGKVALSWDGTLAAFAQQRADYFNQKDDLDNHDGFRQMMQDNGFARMGFNELGENSGIGHNTADGVALIEHVYGSSPGHNENQLSDKFTHVGIGISGSATNFVFGGKKR